MSDTYEPSAVPGLTKRSGMISLDLPSGTVPTVPGGPADHHITVVYLGRDIGDEEYANACARAQAAAAEVAGPLSGTVSGIDSFEPSAGSDGKVPAFAPVVLPGIEILRTALEDLSASEHRDHHPHITLAYLDEGDPLPDPVPPTLVTFTCLTVHRGADAASFPLGPVSTGSAGR
jgi:2'-5' RNA ligase